MGGFSLLTAATTMSQYFEERKDTKEQEKIVFKTTKHIY